MISSSAFIPRTLDPESASFLMSSHGRYDVLQNPPVRKIPYHARQSTASNNDDSWGLWLGFLFCFIFFFIIIFVLWYPADYYYLGGNYHNDRNMNGVPDHREFRAYQTHPYNYWW